MLEIAGRENCRPECMSSNGPKAVHPESREREETSPWREPQDPEWCDALQRNHGVGDGRLRILMRCEASLICGSVVHGVFVLIPRKFEGFPHFFGPGGKRNGAKKMLRNGSDRRCVRGRVAGGRFQRGVRAAIAPRQLRQTQPEKSEENIARKNDSSLHPSK